LHSLPLLQLKLRRGPTFSTAKEGHTHLFELLASQGRHLALVAPRETLMLHAVPSAEMVPTSSDAQGVEAALGLLGNGGGSGNSGGGVAGGEQEALAPAWCWIQDADWNRGAHVLCDPTVGCLSAYDDGRPNCRHYACVRCKQARPMRAVAQRVTQAKVEVGGEVVGSIGLGLLVYLGAGKGDGPSDVAAMAQKLVGLRIFGADQGKLSRSVRDVGGSGLAEIPVHRLDGGPGAAQCRHHQRRLVTLQQAQVVRQPRVGRVRDQVGAPGPDGGGRLLVARARQSLRDLLQPILQHFDRPRVGRRWRGARRADVPAR